MRPILLAALSLLAVSPLALAAQAATLRPMATLDERVVRLSDLFDEAGPNAGRVLGPAPGLGGRIVVEAAQLGAIARQFKVDWQPASSADRSVLDRQGRPFPREEAIVAIRAALTAAGGPPDGDLELPGFAPPLVPLTGKAEPVVSRVEYDAASGRFAAIFSVTGTEMDPVNMRIAGRVQETVEVPVPVARLPAGTVLGASDLRVARIRASLVRPDVAQVSSQAIGMALRNATTAGQPLALADLMRPPLVLKGATILMQLESGGINVAAQGQALASGALGEHVRVLNPVSRAVLDAEVVGSGRVRVRPDSTPLVTTGRTTLASGQ